MSDHKTYAEWVLEALDSPDVLWKVAFDAHLSVHQRNLLTVLASLPSSIEVTDLEVAWTEFSASIKTETKIGDFLRSLGSLEGSMLQIQKRGQWRMVSFRDPSVADFMISFLDSDRGAVRAIAHGIVCFEQLQVLSSIAAGGGWSRGRGRREPSKGVSQAMNQEKELLSAHAMQLLREPSVSWEDSWRDFSRRSVPVERRLTFLLRGSDWFDLDDRWIENELRAVASAWRLGEGDKADAVVLAGAVGGDNRVQELAKRHVEGALLDWLSKDPDDMEDWAPLLDFLTARQSLNEMQDVISDFHDFVLGELDDWPPRSLYLLDEYAQQLGLDDLMEGIEEARAREEDEERQAGEGIGPHVDPEVEETEDVSDDEIELLFANLLRDRGDAPSPR